MRISQFVDFLDSCLLNKIETGFPTIVPRSGPHFLIAIVK